MLLEIITLLISASLGNARVTFKNSEVLQASDFANTNRVAFKCTNGCQIYTDSKDDLLFIVEYNTNTKQYDVVTNFNNIGGTVPMLPVPYKLKSSTNYFIENRGADNLLFVFYAVDDNAPNINTAVLIIGDDWGLDLNGEESKVTVLSSKYESMRYSQFSGAFQNGYPRIYATGFDTVADCAPVYQARNQETASLAAITVFSPITTVDYGYKGQHNVMVKWNANNMITSNARSSMVYTSPGYVGCPYIRDQSYWSSLKTLSDTFKVDSVSLNLNAAYNLPQAADKLAITVNTDQNILTGVSTFNRAYNDNSYKITINWSRSSAAANFAVQLDFGMGKSDGGVTTGPGGGSPSPVSNPVPTTTQAVPQPTTSSSRTAGLGLLSVVFVVIGFL